jgi:hypothetical protein
MKKQMKIRINKQLQMVCDTLGTTPEQVLQDFADNLSLDYRYTSGSDERAMAVEYFMRVGYGMHLFDFDEVQRMFDELNTIRYSFYNYGNDREKEFKKVLTIEYRAFLKKWKTLKAKKEKELLNQYHELKAKEKGQQ